MKKMNFLVVIATVCVCILCGCIASKPMSVNYSNASSDESPFGETYTLPCEVYDTPTEFAATGIYRGSAYQKGECLLNALENAKQQVYAKYHHVYKGMISNYNSTIGNNRGNDISTKLERAGDQVVNAILNDVMAVCQKFSKVQDDGMIECYVGIKVPKGEIAEKVAKKVADVLTDEEKDEIGFQEYNYRKQMEERMANYKEENK